MVRYLVMGCLLCAACNGESSPTDAGAGPDRSIGDFGSPEGAPDGLSTDAPSGNGQWVQVPGNGPIGSFLTATLLRDDRVLVAGGIDNNVALADAYLYDPKSNTFTPTGKLSESRGHHGAALLPDGRVMVIGGADAWTLLASTEIFDPTASTWTMGPPLSGPREDHRVVTLQDGRLLVAGGGAPRSMELFDPATSTWTTSAAEMRDVRIHPGMTVLSDGKVLVAGGERQGQLYNSSAEIFDPATETLTDAPSNLHHARSRATFTRLKSGEVMVVGGFCNGCDGKDEIFDPAKGFSIVTTPLNTVTFHAAALLGDGRLVVCGGSWGAMSAVFDPATKSWSSTASLIYSRSAHTAVTLGDGSVLVVGGVGKRIAERYQP